MGLSIDQDPVASAARGAVHGLLDWTKEQVKEFAEKIRRGELAFVQDKETIEIVVEERKTEEWAIFKKYLRDSKLRIQFQMGLALRRLEKSPSDVEKLRDLRGRILKKYGTAGLRAAELVQRGILAILFSRFLSGPLSPADIQSSIERLLNRVEEYAWFVQEKDDARYIVQVLQTRILARSPSMFVVLGHGKAKTKAKTVVRSLLDKLPPIFDAEVFDAKMDYFAFIGIVQDGELRLALPV